MINISDNLQIIGAKLKKYSLKYQRPEDAVNLLAVSKRHSTDKIKEAYNYGQRSFGENYVQELLQKKDELQDLNIEWHFIGPLQSNKAKKISTAANWVHAVDRFKIAKRLSEYRPDELVPLSICLQVNISGESSKSGVEPSELIPLAIEVAKLPNIRLRGLMVIPAPEKDTAKQRKVFAEVAKLRETLQQALSQSDIDITLDTLSMGMSNDVESAIAEGASIVRIGTAIFGQRDT